MNKPPQPITGPPSVPHPAPSPGLTPAVYPPGQPASVVFATPPPPMNSAPQPRQSYYPRGSLQSNAPRVATSNPPRPVPPPHVYPSSSQMVMIPQQQLPFPPNSQGPAYFIQSGQYRAPYVHQTQQYSVASAPAGFYPGTNPDYSSTYEAALGARERRGGGGRGAVRENSRLSHHAVPLTSHRYSAGAYYPAQAQYQPSVPAAPVMMNPAQQQQAPPPQQQAPPQQQKRERKQIRIRDPNQGGRDITEEIMSGGRTTSTPTPPHSVGAEVSGSVQTNGESVTPAAAAPVVRLDDRVKSSSPVAPASTPPPRSDPTPEPKSVPDVLAAPAVPVPPGQSEDAASDPSPSSSPAPTALPAEPTTSDGVDAPVPPETTPQKKEEEQEEEEEEEPNAAPAEQPCAHVETAEPEKETEPRIEAPLPDSASNVAPTEQDTPPAAAAATTAAANGETESHEVTPTPAPIATPVSEPESVPVVNGLPQDPEELQEEKLEAEPEPEPEPEAAEVQEVDAKTSASAEEEEEEGRVEEEPVPAEETTMQAVQSVPKKKKMKKSDLNNKVVGDVLDAYKEPEEKELAPEPAPAEVQPSEPRPAASPSPEETEETWEEKEDKLDTENIEPETAKPVEQKYQYKEEHWKPINPEEKKRYDREFLLRFQFISASMHKPEGLPHITDVVLDKANKTPLRPLDPSRLMNCGPDFTPSFANLGRAPPGGGRGPPPGPRRSQQGQRKEPRKIITSMSLNDDVQLNKAEKAWKPTAKKSRADEDDPEVLKTQELFRRVRSILNKLTPQMFQQLMKQVTELTIDTEERLKGVIDLIFEKAISEPNFSVAYANMCRCLMGLKVPTSDKPGATVNFRKLLLNRCQKEFEKDKDDDEIFEQKQKELDAATEEEVRQRLKEELEEAKDQARRRSLGNIKFIGELFKLKMLTEPIMHDCIVKLLKNHDEESLECLCRLLSTIGKDLDFEKAKPRMDQYFHQMEKIIKERKTSSRIRFMLQDVLDLRRNNWVPRRGDQGPKTIDQIHKEAELEEHREQVKVQQQLLSKKDSSRGRGGRMGQPQDEGWNTVPISTKNRPIDTSRLSKITKPGALDFNNQLLAPGGKGSWGSWGKGSSGGSGAKTSTEQDTGRPATSTLNRFSALQQSGPSSTSSSSSLDSERRVPQRSSSSRERSERDRDRFDRLDRRDSREDRDRGLDRTRVAVTKRSFSRESEDRSRGGDVRRVSSMTDERERGSRDRTASRETAVKRETAPAPTPAPSKPALSEEEVEKKSTAIVEEYLHINDLKEAVQCVQELNSASVLFVFVRNAVESTLERSTIAREHMGLLLHKLISAAILPPEQYYKGLREILEVADDMAIDIPHIWLYLAEIITPMLQDGGIPMGPLFREVAKPLLPIGKAAVLLVHILNLLCKGLSHKKAGALWTDAGLNWKDFLPEDEDVNKFVTEQKVEFTLGEESEKPSKKELSAEELSKSLDRLIQDKASNQRIHDWVEANLDEKQMTSSSFVRAIMTSVCQAAIVCENPYKVDVEQITQRAKLLQKYLVDEQKELQALYALQALMVRLEQPANLLRMFFDALYDEDVIKEEAFYKWESSKDPAEQVGKGVALKSVTAFFTWLREAEEESDNS
ncbi:eukaryotic translation initiation factor 4 gamma 1a isoform X3 [Pangasianodon hypophthalmus]|uniref:eukaryotic translation initiation factor 4 gamma 1a isoform X3 n=2 Tax=Pangasianodon hypophthalmus TaxID=310915 RepID=UPI002306FC54|nr:eukaryotic translation initiation factor 4 gamma 1a isoform X3 [Pangasianodon hypophthalmus]